MEKEQLHRFFAGMVSIEEGIAIKKWVESSEENKKAFYQERKLFDALLVLHNDNEIVPQKHITQKNKIFIKWLKIAAIILLTFAFNHLYQEYRLSGEHVSLNTVSVPAGQRTNIILPDGTNVWLNARTTLQFPTTFSKSQRTVILTGEAYFDVSHNKKSPFIVQTEKYNIEVLGTRFNVNAYPDQQIFETTLMAGSVKVIPQNFPEKAITLTPNHKAYADNDLLKTSKVNDYNPYRWKEGLIYFKNTAFQNIMKDFEKYYGIRILIKNKNVLKYSYTGKFRQSDGLDYALRVLQKDIHFKYEKNNEEQIIYIN